MRRSLLVCFRAPGTDETFHAISAPIINTLTDLITYTSVGYTVIKFAAGRVFYF